MTPWLIAGFLLLVATQLFTLLVMQHKQIQKFNLELKAQKNQLEDELRFKAKLAFLGLQTAEICHNLNHYLQSGMNYAELMREQGARADFLNRLGEAHENILRLTKTMAELLGPAQNLKLKKQFIHPAVQKSIRAIVEPFPLREKVKVVCDLPSDAEIFFDDTLPDVLNNLLKNALESMSSSSSPEIRFGWKDNTLEIQDNGSGIPAEDLEKVFSPVYSSKGKSVGLGLGYIRHRCELNMGELTIYQSSPKGTTFRLKFGLFRS